VLQLAWRDNIKSGYFLKCFDCNQRVRSSNIITKQAIFYSKHPMILPNECSACKLGDRGQGNM
jgi:hypothetical protein